MIIGEWADKKKLFEIAVTIAIEEEIIQDDSELDYELCGQRGYFYRLVSKKRELIARINIKKINQIRYSRNGVKKDSLGKIQILPSIYIGTYYLMGFLLPAIISAAFVGAATEEEALNSLPLYLFIGALLHFGIRETVRKLGVIKKRRLIWPEILLAIFVFFYWLTNSVFIISSVPSPSAMSSAVKNGLVYGVKECVVRNADDRTTNFLDAQSFSSSNFTGFEIKPLNINSCFQAKAIPKVKFKNVNTWFEIKMNTATGEVTKKCGDQSKRGCNKGNTW